MRLFAGAALTVTIAAINRPSGARFEGHLGLFSAFTAGNCEHLAVGGGKAGGSNFLPFSRMFGSAGSPFRATGRTAFRWMVVSFGLESLLLFNAENIGSPAVETHE